MSCCLHHVWVISKYNSSFVNMGLSRHLSAGPGSELGMFWFTPWSGGRWPSSVSSSLHGADNNAYFIRLLWRLNENKKSFTDYVVHSHRSVNVTLLLFHWTILTYDQLLLIIWLVNQKISSVLLVSQPLIYKERKTHTKAETGNYVFVHFVLCSLSRVQLFLTLFCSVTQPITQPLLGLRTCTHLCVCSVT